MIRSFVLLAAVLLVASLTRGHAIENAITKPAGSITMMFAKDDLRKVVRPAHSSKCKFTGTLKGKYSIFANSGTYDGKFNGVAAKGQGKGVVSAKFRGTFDMFGHKGKDFGNLSGKFAWRPGFARVKGPFDYTYMGTYDGKKTFAKAAGTYSMKASHRGLTVKERGTLTLRTGDVRIKGSYTFFFNGKWIAAKFKGTIDGKKFSFASKGSFEGIEKYISNMGSVSVTCKGKTTTSTFNSMDFFRRGK